MSSSLTSENASGSSLPPPPVRFAEAPLEDRAASAHLLDEFHRIITPHPNDYAHGINDVYRDEVMKDGRRRQDAVASSTTAQERYRSLATALTGFEREHIHLRLLERDQLPDALHDGQKAGLRSTLPGSDLVIHSCIGVDSAVLSTHAKGPNLAPVDRTSLPSVLPTLLFIIDTTDKEHSWEVLEHRWQQPGNEAELPSKAVQLAVPFLEAIHASVELVKPGMVLLQRISLFLAIGFGERLTFCRLNKDGNDLVVSRIFAHIPCKTPPSMDDFIHLSLVRKMAADELVKRLNLKQLDQRPVRGYSALTGGPPTELTSPLIISEAGFKHLLPWPKPGDDVEIAHRLLRSMQALDSEQLITIGLTQGSDPDLPPDERDSGLIVGMIHMIGNEMNPANIDPWAWQRVIEVGQMDPPPHGVHYLSYPDCFLVVLNTVAPP
ncbi:hypothetical protein OC835_007619 [Tilletia horrida]|nr:hypothetical protein OC835_007619 [Tilletia horrida]